MAQEVGDWCFAHARQLLYAHLLLIGSYARQGAAKHVCGHRTATLHSPSKHCWFCVVNDAGDWLLLKNLHLVVSWLPELEKAIHSIAGDRSPSFRLFLASQSHAKFPQALLERSNKVGTAQRLLLLLLLMLMQGGFGRTK